VEVEMAIMAGTFTGFRPEAVQFLADLAANNDRAWFQPRKADYGRLLKVPLESLCVALADRFAARNIPLAADPARSPFRIHRDVRFSKDKSPYKTNVGASFAWVAGRLAAPGALHGDREGGHGVGGYFHLQPGEIYIGGGMWHPEPGRLAGWRALLLGDAGQIHRAIDDPAFKESFGELSGDRLKRVPAGVPPDHPEAELLKLKDVVFGRHLSDREAFSADLPDIMADALATALPLFRILAELPG